jgi:hypothetical protein
LLLIAGLELNVIGGLDQKHGTLALIMLNIDGLVLESAILLIDTMHP